MSSLNSCEQYDCNEITWTGLHIGEEVYSISSNEEVKDADDYLFCVGSELSSSSDLERQSFCPISSNDEEVTDADDHFDCGSGLSSGSGLEEQTFCSKVQSNSNNASQKKRAFSKVTLTRDRKRLKPIDGEVECLLLDDGELGVSQEGLPCIGYYNNEVIIL
jgi:hypothetical protein